MRVSLVNTNTYVEPPVIPIGMEYLVAPLETAGHEVRARDLAFREDPAAELASFLESSKPDVIGFSVRNVDTTLYDNNISFLEEISKFVSLARELTGAVTVAGGAATQCSGRELRERLGVDHLVRGPGEKALPALLEAIAGGSEPEPVTDGWREGIIPDLVHPRAKAIRYRRYTDAGAPAGIEFRKGCDRGCPFCLERLRPVMARDIKAVIEEARALACDERVGTLFICDSEVNLDSGDTCAFLGALADEDLPLTWSGYFLPVPFDPLMARLTRASGCTSLTLSVNSWELEPDGSGPYSAADVERFCELCRGEGIGVAIDLLVGYPGEQRVSIERTVEAIESAEPETVGVNPFIRLYENTPVTGLALAPDSGGVVLGRPEENPGFLEPVWYRGVERDWLTGLLAGHPRFRIEGAERTVNYQRVS